jgi:hypothetical protein
MLKLFATVLTEVLMDSQNVSWQTAALIHFNSVIKSAIGGSNNSLQVST